VIYEFIEEKTGEIIEKEFPMMEVPTEFVENGKKYKRHWVFSKSVHIPFQWNDSVNRPNYSKSPSQKKHFY
jgi:hypothetical protein